MPEWIKVRADEIKRVEMERKIERERQAVEANELKLRTEPFWKDLLNELEAAVKAFNTEFPETERRIDQFEKPSASGLSIRRTAYPSVTVKAQLNNAGTMVQYTISRTQRKGTDPVEKQSAFAYTVVDGHVDYAEGSVRAHDDVARIFLDSFFDF